MLLDLPHHSYTELKEAQAPMGFARHFALSEFLAGRTCRLIESQQELYVEGMESAPAFRLGAFSRRRHRFRWAESGIVKALRELGRHKQGYLELLDGEIDPDSCSPFVAAATWSRLVGSRAAFFYLMSDTGFSLMLLPRPPSRVEDMSIHAISATLNEAAKSCGPNPESVISHLAKQLGFHYEQSESTGLLNRTSESIEVSYFESSISLKVLETKGRLVQMGTDRVKKLEKYGLDTYLKKDYDRASEIFLEALSLDPQSPTAQLYLGIIDLQAERLDSAQLRLQLVTRLDPERDLAWAQLAACYSRKGLLKQAIYARRKALIIKPDDSFSLASLGVLLGKCGETAEGIESLKRAVTLRPERPYAFRRLADLYEQTGQISEAIAACQQALDLAPEHEGTKRLMQRLRGKE